MGVSCSDIMLGRDGTVGRKPGMVTQTAGHDALGDFAPKFAELNDDVLFGELWSRESELPLKLRSIVTVSALIGKGIVDDSLRYHLQSARENGVSKTEMAELLTHVGLKAARQQ